MRWMWLASTVLFGLASSLVAAESDKPAWKAAAAKQKITPTEPMFMAGYASRTKPSEGVALDLFAKALVLEDALGQQQAIVTLDLIGVPRSLRERLEKQIADQFQWKPESLFINASHTHCGPELRVSRLEESGIESDRTAQAQAYTANLERTIVDLLRDCRSRLTPAKLGYSHARCGFAMNRRLPTPSGYQNSPYPDGPVDHDVPVLRVDSPDGKQLHAILFGYACHNTTLSFQQFCGDYAGFAQQALEEAHPGTTALFVLGCGGDQNPYPRGQLEQCQQHGRSLASAVEAALLPTSKPLTGPLSRAIDVAVLQFAPPASRDELQKQAESKSRFEASHAKRLLRQLDEDGKIPLEYPALTQVIRFGSDLTLIAMSGEVVVDYSLRLKRELGNENVWVAGYSNDVFGYVPSQRVLKEGGYEAGGAMLYTSFPGPFAEDVEERLIAGIRALLEKTRSARK
ncbi:MAG TPA: neutral/alkaline non-lysosomal ceramidase N-terminal domain-containing protein [Planctomycetaceae bacterium]|nr:neutral/alkaline non-lysosomal ceramidase N-terminal domain-containing protein [Planctomycetaceae bacterium]